MREVSLKRLVFTVLFVVFVAAIVYGVTDYQFLETMINGTMICLSCIGVG